MAKRKDQAAPAGASARPKRATKADGERATIAREECAAVAAQAAERVTQAAAAEPATRPRPTGFDQVLADRILERLAEGESVRSITADLAMPAKSTVFRWLAANPDFAEAYAAAKSIGLEVVADELLDIADDGSNDWIERLGRDGQPAGYEVNGEAIQRSKVRLETRRWLLERLAASKYAPSSTVNHKGAIGVAAVEMDADQAKRVAQAVLDGMTPTEDDAT